MFFINSGEVAIIVLISVLLMALLIIGLIVFFKLRKKAYEKFVLANSRMIAKLKSLNERYVFKMFDKNQYVYQKFDNKSHYLKTESIAVLTKDVRDHIQYWYNLSENVMFNIKLFEGYTNEIKIISTPISKEVCESNKKNYKKCAQIEKELFDSMKQTPNTDINIIVHLRYVSPKGRVDLSSKRAYKYEHLLRILDSVSRVRLNKETYDLIVKAERGILSDSMRYDVLRRDGFKCVLCGISAKDGAILHVDHIIPVSKGGKTVMSNLRTLCERCNIGKSNKIE